MDKNEILAKSRQENNNGDFDEKEKLVRINGQSIGFLVVAAMLILYVAFIDRTQYEAVSAILWSGIAAANIYEAIKVRKPFYIFAAIALTFVAIGHIVLFFKYR
ncbi:MAG: hypothetical protein IJK26_03405 [Clostridia bacterium]|nr:hypothetical protein [Clostridia bacterium]